MTIQERKDQLKARIARQQALITESKHRQIDVQCEIARANEIIERLQAEKARRLRQRHESRIDY